MALGRLGRKAEADTDRVDRLQGLFDARFRDLERFPEHIEIFLADGPAREQFFAPFEIGPRQLQGRLPAVESRHTGVQIGDLVIHVLDGVFELVAIGPGLGHLAAHLGLGGCQVRFGRFHGGFLDGNLNAVRLRVEFDQHVPLLHAVVVIHQDLAHLARHAGSNESDVAVDISVIGRNRVQRRHHPRGKEISADPQANHGPRQQQPFSQAMGWRPGFGRFWRDAGLVWMSGLIDRHGRQTILRFHWRRRSGGPHFRIVRVRHTGTSPFCESSSRKQVRVPPPPTNQLIPKRLNTRYESFRLDVPVHREGFRQPNDFAPSKL